VSTVARQLDAAVANKTLDLFLVRMELKTVESCSRL
jgi:hypothetical protein